MLFTKSILKAKLPEDGLRISVMSRHTLEDGLTLDPRITHDLFDEHLIILAPSPKLVGDYYKKGLSWKDYELRYREFLRRSEVSGEVKNLAQRATQEDITLLCIEETAEFCHRRLLAEECKRYADLQVIHR